MTETLPPPVSKRPTFIDELDEAHGLGCKNVVAFTGNVFDKYPFQGDGGTVFIPLSEGLYRELSRGFTVVRLDIATGITFFNSKDEKDVLDAVGMSNVTASAPEKMPEGDALREMLAKTQHKPLEALILLQAIDRAFNKVRKASDNKVKPLCAVIQFAGAMFPAGDFDRLAPDAKQQLVSFLSWANSPAFRDSDHLVALLASTKTEVNARIFELPTVDHIQVELPMEPQRTLFVERFLERAKTPPVIELPKPDFYGLTTGLKLTQLESLLEASARSRRPISRESVMEDVNRAVKALLGDVAEVKRPIHTPADVVGYAEHGNKFQQLFERAKDRKKAPQVVLISGPNGGGKTYQLEAYAGASGWVVLVIKGVRSMWFGETDRLFEVLRFIIKCFGKCVIIFDEAHTKFANIHGGGGNNHETEVRLTGNYIEMMSDKSLLGLAWFALATSRPDLLNPDMRSRASIQIPITDLFGPERIEFVTSLYARDKLSIEPTEMEEFMRRTQHYSARDYFNLGQEARTLEMSLLHTLDEWQAPSSLVSERRYQSLVAAQNCSYPKLLSQELRDMGPEKIAEEIAELRLRLRY